MVPGTAFESEVVIRRRRFASDETGFGVLDADWDDDEIVLVGTIAHLEPRARARGRGVWKEDHRYGLQVHVSLAEPVAPSGAALAAYLRRVKHVGAAPAARATPGHGDDVVGGDERAPG